MKMTKAERIFRATLFNVEKHIENFGFEECKDTVFRMVHEDNELLSTRTYNDIIKECEKYKNHKKNAYKYGIITKEDALTGYNAACIVQKSAEYCKQYR